jgi:hypothetical protein
MRLFGAAEALSERVIDLFIAFHPKLYITAARDLLSDPELAAAWEEGRRMTLEQAIQYALEAR